MIGQGQYKDKCKTICIIGKYGQDSMQLMLAIIIRHGIIMLETPTESNWQLKLSISFWRSKESLAIWRVFGDLVNI